MARAGTFSTDSRFALGFEAGVGALKNAERLKRDFSTRGLSSPGNLIRGVVSSEKIEKCNMGLATMCEI